MGKILAYTTRRIIFVLFTIYFLPILSILYISQIFNLQKFNFPYNFDIIVLVGLILLSGVILISVGVYYLVKYGKGSPNPKFPTKKLVTIGIYSQVRHPVYLGTVIIWFGTSLLSNSIVLFLSTILLFVLLHFYALNEEKILEKKFGKYYLNYKKKVPMWI